MLLYPCADRILLSEPMSLQFSVAVALVVPTASVPVMSWVSSSVKLSYEVVTVSETVIVPMSESMKNWCQFN